MDVFLAICMCTLGMAFWFNTYTAARDSNQARQDIHEWDDTYDY